jgi:exodeoxyribonuclease VII large subunit
MAVSTWTVDELCRSISVGLQNIFPEEIWVRGQIVGLTRSQAGHLYFDLVEPEATNRKANSKMSIVAFKGQLSSIESVLKKLGNLTLEDGIEVRIRGRVSYYAPQGRVQFIMSAVDPQYTLGHLAAERDQVLRILASEGLLELNKSLTLPMLPLRIGLVTSDGSAAYNDFTNELLTSRYPFQIFLVDARVQGSEAESAIVNALKTITQTEVDVIAVVRGGGAESVARAIANCPIPVFAGIGHEIDRSITDEVAHTSVKTPTACAVALIEQVNNFEVLLGRLSSSIANKAQQRLARANETLENSGSQIAKARTVIQLQDVQLAEFSTDLTRFSNRALEQAKKRIQAAADLQRAFHPLQVLRRGFSITRDQNGFILRDEAPPGTQLITETFSATISSQVTTSSRKETQ